MILWFAGPAILGAWSVLRDPAFDYRLLAVGALAPDLIDAPAGHEAVAHTLAFAVASLVVVMVGTTGRRRLRRHLIALPIGLFAHLVLDGVWTNTSLFWWPAGHWGSSPLTVAPAVLVLREALGLLAAVFVIRRFGLTDPQRRRTLFRTGRLSPAA